MKLDSALRYKIFSHLPGTECILPGSGLVCRFYPTKFEVCGLESVAQVAFSNIHILRQFTVTADLEGFAIVVSGFSDEEYFRYQVVALDGGFVLTILKAPADLVVDILDTKYQVEEKANCYFFYTRTQELLTVPHRERLSLGCTKAQDVEMIFRRQDIREIVPLWFYYAQSVTAASESVQMTGVVSQQQLQNLALIGFQGIFVPRLQDDLHYGVQYPWLQPQTCSATALKNSFWYLRQLFFRENSGVFSFLPQLLPQFYCGRLIGLKTQNDHSISFEWTKKKMRRLMIWPSQDDLMSVDFPSNIESFRAQSGTFRSILKNGAQLFLKKDIPLLLDNFQK